GARAGLVRRAARATDRDVAVLTLTARDPAETSARSTAGRRWGRRRARTGVRDGHARASRVAVVAVRLAVAPAHGRRLLRANLRLLRPRARLLGGAAHGVDREVAVFAAGTRCAGEAAAGNLAAAPCAGIRLLSHAASALRARGGFRTLRALVAD